MSRNQTKNVFLVKKRQKPGKYTGSLKEAGLDVEWLVASGIITIKIVDE